jgi:hypothetical protein
VAFLIGYSRFSSVFPGQFRDRTEKQVSLQITLSSHFEVITIATADAASLNNNHLVQRVLSISMRVALSRLSFIHLLVKLTTLFDLRPRKISNNN